MKIEVRRKYETKQQAVLVCVPIGSAYRIAYFAALLDRILTNMKWRGCGLDGPGLNSGRSTIFAVLQNRPDVLCSSPSLLIQWVPGCYLPVKQPGNDFPQE
jgi:hypothetical protein